MSVVFNKKNKRGISPLIATVLIIGFTVALAAIIITWGSRFVIKTTEDVEEQTDAGLLCSKLNYKISKVECDVTTGNFKSLELVNDANINIVSTYIRITDPNTNSVKVDPSSGVGPYGVAPAAWDATESVSLPKNVEVVPVVQVPGADPISCSAAIEDFTPIDTDGDTGKTDCVD